MENNENVYASPFNAATIKGIFIVILTLVLLLPSTMLKSLIFEREGRKQGAISEVSAKWGNAQQISGPIISVPYVLKAEDKNSIALWNYYHFLPENLDIKGELKPESRKRGIFEVVLYRTLLNLTGSFTHFDYGHSTLTKEQFLWDKAIISVGIPDLRGIEEQIEMDINGKKHKFNSGLPTKHLFQTGVSATIDLSNVTDDSLKFSLNLDIKGSQDLSFIPIGKITNANLNSTWQKPSFSGAFLPDKHTINDNGFTANWKILHLNRPFPQSWSNTDYKLSGSEFMVNMLSPIDNYGKIARAVQYGILVIGLTFLIFFFIELLNNKSVHIIQYALVGLALVVFYSLLLSISEHLNFNNAYVISAIMTILLIAGYAYAILKERTLAMLIGSSLTMLYAFIFIILQMEDYALMTGSIGIFLTLAVIMYFSGKINWQSLGKK
jgi:inner membrane protein